MQASPISSQLAYTKTEASLPVIPVNSISTT